MFHIYWAYIINESHCLKLAFVLSWICPENISALSAANVEKTLNLARLDIKLVIKLYRSEFMFHISIGLYH